MTLAALLLLLCLRGHTTQLLQDKLAGVRTVDVQAVEGMSAQFPCELATPTHDKVYMLFWFKDDAGIPLYSFDVRGKPLSEARHWSAPEVFGPRAVFVPAPGPAALLVRDVKRRDEGVYRCRVDFRNTQTTSFRYNLTVVVPPERPVVVDRWGRVISSTTLGPHEEGDDVMLTCRVLGGRPEPSVRWLVNGVLVDDEYEHNTGDVIENRLLWPAVRRADYAAVFTCQADNSPLVPPRDLSLVLDMFLRPLTVELRRPAAGGGGGGDGVHTLTAERRYEVTCVSAGSRPPALLSWYKGKRQLRRTTEEVRDNETVSVLSFVPTMDDDGRALTCRAENPNVTSLFLDTSWTLSVVYPPVVRLRLGSSLAAADIKEGDDVYFECHVRANPPARKLFWLHNERPLIHNASARVFHSNQSLVLQKVTRHSSGRYACSAINPEGETVSNELQFTVKYAPRCRHNGDNADAGGGAGAVGVVGAMRGEEVVVECRVDAEPPAAQFRWKFNSSGESVELPPRQYSGNGSVSRLRYVAAAEPDFGTLSCLAINSAGPQLEPCLFRVVAASRPAPPRNCSLTNLTADSVHVSCEPGFDGGLPQSFLLELYAAGQRAARASLRSPEPAWTVRGLEWHVKFSVAVVAVNDKGRSPPALLDDLVLTDPEQRTASPAPLSPAAGVAGCAGGAGLLLVLVACVAVLRRRPAPPALKLPPPAHHAAHPARPLTPAPPDDKEPDLIPNHYSETSGPDAASPARTSDVQQDAWARVATGDARMDACVDACVEACTRVDVDAIKEKLLDRRIPESCV